MEHKNKLKGNQQPESREEEEMFQYEVNYAYLNLVQVLVTHKMLSGEFVRGLHRCHFIIIKAGRPMMQPGHQCVQ